LILLRSLHPLISPAPTSTLFPYTTLFRSPVINNIDVAVESDPERIRDALARQAAGPVRWTQVIQAMSERGVTHVIECGPGKVLGSLTRRIVPALNSLSVSDPASLRQALSAVQG